MKKLILTFAILAALALHYTPALTQTTTTTTTLSTAIANSRDTSVVVASATGITASSASVTRYILIDKELMRVRAVSGTTLTVVRGSGGSFATPHSSGALVVFGPAGSWNPDNGHAVGVFLSGAEPVGPCTSGSNQYLPLYHTPSGKRFNCVSTQWREAVENPGLVVDAIFCGDLPNNTTHYTSPVSGYAGGILYTDGLTATDLSFGLAGTGCAAEDNTTEATADEVMFANNAVRVLGLYCAVSGSGSNGVTLRMRSAAASLTPDVAITIPTGSTTGATQLKSNVDIAAGATVAVAAVATEDLSAQDFWCSAKLQILP